MIDGWGICGEIALLLMSLDCTDDQSTLVQVMAWCRQATSHYLIHCWPRYMSTYGVTRPLWVNPVNFSIICCFIFQNKTYRISDQSIGFRISGLIHKLLALVNNVLFSHLTILPISPAKVYHYSDVIMGAMASQITTVYSIVYSGAVQRKHKSF